MHVSSGSDGMLKKKDRHANRFSLFLAGKGGLVAQIQLNSQTGCCCFVALLFSHSLASVSVCPFTDEHTHLHHLLPLRAVTFHDADTQGLIITLSMMHLKKHES